MSAAHSRWSSVRVAACAILAGAYVAIGVVRVLPVFLAGGSSAARNPWSSTDKYLLNAAGLEDGSQEILRTLARVPAGKPVAVFALESSPSSTLTAYVVSYLAWPRPTQIIAMGGSQAKPEPIRRANFGALFFCGMAPPPDVPAAERLGSNITFSLLPNRGDPQP